MLDPYRRVLSHPGALAFSATGVLARLPISMMTLGIVVLVSRLSGSYALAGQVSAAYVVGNAAVAVPHGRLTDRFGQHRILLLDAVGFAVFTTLTVVSLTRGWPTPWPHALALLTGVVMPPVGTMVRARWAHVLDREEERHTAFAVESVADEMVFVTGPALVTALSTAIAPQAGLVVALLVGTAGTLALALQRRTEPRAHPHRRGQERARMPWGLLVPLTVSGAALGCLFGALEVATVAFSGDQGQEGAAGVLLGIFSLGSLLAGVAAGTRAWHRGPLSRSRIGMVLLAVGVVVLPWAPSVPAVAVVLFLTGMTLAPTLIALFSLIEAAVPRSRLNEAMGFVQTGVAGGIAPGTWLAGIVADRSGGSAAYVVCAVSAVLAAACGMAVRDGVAARPREIASVHGDVDQLGRDRDGADPTGEQPARRC